MNGQNCRYLVMDEADRILNMDFEKEVNQILAQVPAKGRRNMLFSATMTKKVAKLQRASLTDPVKVEVSSKYQTVDKLHQVGVTFGLILVLWKGDLQCTIHGPTF